MMFWLFLVPPSTRVHEYIYIQHELRLKIHLYLSNVIRHRSRCNAFMHARQPMSMKGGLVSPYVREMAPCSKILHKLMDEEEQNYVQSITTRPSLSSLHSCRASLSALQSSTMTRSLAVQDMYIRAVQRQTQKNNKDAVAIAAGRPHTQEQMHPLETDKTSKTITSHDHATRPQSSLVLPTTTTTTIHRCRRTERPFHGPLYHFYNRQVFSLGEPPSASDALLELRSLPVYLGMHTYTYIYLMLSLHCFRCI